MTIQVNSEIKLELVYQKHMNELYLLASKNLSHLSPWLDWTVRCTSPTFMHQFIEQSTLDFSNGSAIPFVILYRNEIVGRIGIYKIHEKQAEIGYWIGKDHQKKGIVFASAKSLLHFAYAQVQLRLINLYCANNNEPSKKLAQKLGFDYIKLIPNGEQVNAVFHDLLHFELSVSKWRSQQNDKY